MLGLRKGDRLPSVGLIQKLVNDCRLIDSRLKSVTELQVDGIFGNNTKNSILETQRALKLPKRDGQMNPSTWQMLSSIVKWRIVDVCDLVAEAHFAATPLADLRNNLLEQVRGHSLHSKKQQREQEALVDKIIRKWKRDISDCRDQYLRFQKMGGKPIAIKNVKQVYSQIRRELKSRNVDGWKTVLLRFTGHGSAGSQGVAGSLIRKGLTYENVTMSQDNSAADVAETIVINGMTMPMAPFGIVELHGCNIAQKRAARNGRTAVNGPAFVSAFARAVGRPTSAGTSSQYIGSVSDDIRFEGRTVTCMPNKSTINSWFTESRLKAR